MTIEINMNKTRVKKKFKRYGQHRAGTGHDTAHRDMDISEEQMAENWCRTFGHRVRDGICTNQGCTYRYENTTAFPDNEP